MKTKFARHRYPRTNGCESQPAFDRMLQEISISGLCYLKGIYKKRLNYFTRNHDMTLDDNKREYRLIAQRYNMIRDEYINRNHFEYNNYLDNYLSYDSETGNVMDVYGTITYNISFNHQEDTYLYDGIIENTELDDDYYDDIDPVCIDCPISKNKKLSGYCDNCKIKRYKNWDYYKDGC